MCEDIKVQNRPFKEKIKSIKLWTTIILSMLFTLLLTKYFISESSYVSLVTILIISFFGSNTATKFTNNQK